MNKKDYICLYDGTFEGFLSLVFYCFKFKVLPKEIKSEKEYVQNLFDETKCIKTNKEKSNRVSNGIRNKISNYTLYNVYNAFLSNYENREIIVFDYILKGFKYGKNINYMRNINSVIEIEKIVKNVRREAHRFYGITRFEETKNGVFFSEIEPDNNILELISLHFKERLKNEYWVIRDKKRELTAFYNKKDFIITDSSNFNFNVLKSEVEDNYEDLWKCFYNSVNIKERKNRRCQLNFLPKKHWKNIVEFKGKA